MKKAALKTLAGNLTLLVGALLVALVLAEALTRVFYPIYDGRQNITEAGEPIESWTAPGTVYFQVGAEYNARTSITAEGHRVPSSGGDPDIIFLGDSNTFGWGLADDETFVSLYCTEAEVTCANLAVPATGTAQQLDRLELFLATNDWSPKRVVLMAFAMTSAFSGGNDLADNFDYVRWSGHRPGQRWSEIPPADASAEPAAPVVDRDEGRVGLLERLLNFRFVLQERSNLVRIIKFHWGPLLKSLLVPDLDEERLTEALDLTEAEFERFARIRDEYGFEVQIYLIHPIQDIMRGTHTETVEMLSAISPFPIRSVAPPFLEEPARFYYPLDGHPNSTGARSIADFLLSTAGPIDRSDGQ